MSKDSFLDLREILKEQVRTAAKQLFGISLDEINATPPPKTELGDLAFPVAFELAKRLKESTGEKRSPRSIAEDLRNALLAVTSVSRVEVAGAGYLNVFFDRAGLLLQLSEGPTSESAPPFDAPKRMVEHTSINPNKAAHIGHVRNAVLGDTFVRILAASGERVEVQNYIDNTGVQVADVVVGFLHIAHLSLSDVIEIDRNLPPERPFDYYCWDLYTQVGLFYRNGDPDAPVDPERLKLRDETLHAIEAGGNPTAELAEFVATRNVECILVTMERLGIRYDVLPRESEILHLKFWDRAFQRMRNLGVIRLETEGKNIGCWVMPFESHTGTDEHEPDKIIVRSNGMVTYTGKDIAYQLWKLGKLGLDFNYRLFRSYPDGHRTYMTTSTDSRSVDNPTELGFGNGATVYNVIDVGQTYPQEIVKRGVALLAPELGEAASIHLSYEKVALSQAACIEMGIQLAEEDRGKSVVEMSGRKGLGVKADDLIDRLETVALAEVEQRHPELAETERVRTAHEIAVGALRYFLLKFTRNSIIAFDFAEALSFEGETGPYCQYSAVRANSIFRKLGVDGLTNAADCYRSALSDADSKPRVDDMFDGESGNEIWTLVAQAGRLEETILTARATAEPAHLAKYTFALARAFNLFYHRHRIIAEEDMIRRSILVLIADYARNQLTRGLSVLGIAVPEQM